METNNCGWCGTNTVPNYSYQCNVFYVGLSFTDTCMYCNNKHALVGNNSTSIHSHRTSIAIRSNVTIHNTANNNSSVIRGVIIRNDRGWCEMQKTKIENKNWWLHHWIMWSYMVIWKTSSSRVWLNCHSTTDCSVNETYAKCTIAHRFNRQHQTANASRKWGLRA